ncbi:hypothetical protein TIFTF001_050673 [Ficus carica]|uniref:Uncharacterized protein n=1 Tax=Ficus carica TaxID=3494 RepID=A0AA88CUD1_FICCA|nr:hypothetical protein TIFTF001_050673 [Ficus carica]
MSACRSRRPARCRLGRFRSLLRQLGIVGVAEGFHEHLYSLGQRLDVPSKDFCLGWPALCPSTSLAPWWSVNEGGDIDCWKGGGSSPPSSAKMLMPEMVPAATPNAFPAGPGARGDAAGSATLGTRWVRRSVRATGLIDGRHVALGPGSVNSRTPWASRARG